MQTHDLNITSIKYTIYIYIYIFVVYIDISHLK